MKRYFCSIVKDKEPKTHGQNNPQSISDPDSPSSENLSIDLQNVSSVHESSSVSSNATESTKRKYCQKPRGAWIKDEHLKSWIIINGDIVNCKYCQVSIKNPKYSNLKEHAQTKKHVDASKPFAIPRRQKQINFEKKKLDQVHESEARTCLFIAKHTSINCIDHLTKVMKTNFPDSRISADTKLSRTKCTAILTNVWHPYFKTKLINDIQDSPFSLLIDESTDVSVVKYLGVVIKYYSISENICKTNLLKLQPLDACDSDAILQAVLTVLKEYNLKIENLCGIGTDNASVMVGSKSGVFAKLKEMNPKLILIPCVCHSIQLAISSAAKEYIPKSVEFMVSETYNWFSRSSPRQQSYETIYKLINEDSKPLKIKQSCQTRWLSIESAVSRIHKQYLELKTYFSITEQTENSFKLSSLSDIYNKEINYAYLCFFKPILQDLQRVNKIFESEKVDFLKVLGDLELLILMLMKKVVKPNCDNDFSFDSDISNFELQTKPYLGIECEEKLNQLETKLEVSNEELIVFRQICKNFLIKLIKELQQRVPRNLKVLKQIKMLSVDECLSQNKSSLQPVLTEMEVEPILADTILNQWGNLFLVKWNNIKDTESFWCEVSSYKDACGENPFQELAKFAISVLVLPISNAEVERIFSQLNLVKTKQRNRLQLLSTNAILIIRNNLRNIKMKCCHNFVIPSIVIKKIGTNLIYNNIETDNTNTSSSDSDC